MTKSSIVQILRKKFGRKALGRRLTIKGISWMFPESPARAYVAARYGLCSQLESDIYEHMHTLKRYAKECSTIAELGVRSVVSTWAFISGLSSSTSGERRLICLDVEPIPEERLLRWVCEQSGIQLQVIRGDSARTPVGVVDLLFIDTLHVEGHLKRELELHSEKVNKFIILHDTTTDGETGETARTGADISALSDKTGYSTQELSRGLMHAVRYFLARSPEWRIAEQYTNNNGLTVLARENVAIPGDHSLDAPGFRVSDAQAEMRISNIHKISLP